MDPNLKGILTELRIQQEFLKYGFGVSVPINPSSRYDMVVDLNGVLAKVQCKSAKHVDGGFLVNLYSTNKLNGKYFKHTYSQSDVDIFATVYDDNVYIIPNNDEISSKQSLMLRTSEPMNHQSIGINYAERFRFDNIMANQLPYNIDG